MIEKRMRKGPDRPSVLSIVTAITLILQLVGCGGGVSTATSGGSAGVFPTGAGVATVTWDANTEPDVIGYRVYFGTSAGNYQQARGAGIDVSGRTNYTVTGLASGMRYFFVVTAVDASGNESAFSREVSKDIL
jgi:fibronectin type III domain protein